MRSKMVVGAPDRVNIPYLMHDTAPVDVKSHTGILNYPF